MIDAVEISSTLTDPAVLAFWASLEFGVSAWTLHIACAYDWELEIIAAVKYVPSRSGQCLHLAAGHPYKFFFFQADQGQYCW